MKFSYDAAWQDLSLLMRAHADVLLVIAGAFLFLPMFAQSLFFSPPQVTQFDAAAMQIFLSYFRENFLALLGIRLVTLIGTGALLALLLASDQPTVGNSISRAGRLLPTLFLADFLMQLMMVAGFVALIIPGFYLTARMAVTSAAIMSEQISNPLRAIGRSFALTRGIGWRIFGLLAIVTILVWIASAAIVAVVGIITQLFLPDATAKIAVELLSAASSTALTLVVTLLSAAIYRQIRVTQTEI
jgi:hypothetical protein